MEKDSPYKQAQTNQNNSDSQNENIQVFPDKIDAPLQHWIKIIEELYESVLHKQTLANFCFKCHNNSFSKVYLQFKDRREPQLVEQPISSFFKNQSFIQLSDLGEFLKQKGQYPKNHIGPIPKNIKSILDQLFQNYGYIPNYQRVLLFFPNYLQKHVLLWQSLFDGSKIDASIASFLAFVACAELGCVYGMNRFYRKFRKLGGDLKWMTLGTVPTKIKILFGLNRLMTKAPWQINEQYLDNILNNSGIQWSNAQFYMFVSVMAFAHQFSSVSLALGLNPDEPLQKSGIKYISKIDKLIKQYHNYLNQPRFLKQQQQLKPARGSTKRDDQQSEQYMKQFGVQLVRQQLSQKICNLAHVVLQPFKPIQKRKFQKYPIIDFSEYNFPFKGYPVLNTYTQKIADRLLNLITLTQALTREINKSINSKEYLRAMRYYAQNLYGYTHHEYDYKSNIGTYLTLSFKFFIRLLTFYPSLINSRILNQTKQIFNPFKLSLFDLTAIALTIASTKMSLQLTMIMKHMPEDD